MKLFAEMRAHLAFLLVFAGCLLMASCKPPDAEKHAGSAGSEEAKKTTLSKEEIVKVADGAARHRGWNPDKMHVEYDEGNTTWREIARASWPELEGRDFQAVAYWHDPPLPEGGLWVLVDRNTGEILSTEEAP